MRNLFYYTLLISTLSSCAFNKKFLKPTVLPPQLNQLSLNNTETGDSLVLIFDENKLPKSEDLLDSIVVSFNLEGHLLKTPVGNTLHAWQISPKSSYNNFSILIFHGNSGSLLNNFRNAVELSKRGFKVMILDYSGFGFSTGDATRKNVLIDGETALKFLSENTDRPKEKIILYGQSLGGNLAAVVAANHPDLLDGLVLEGAFSSHKDIAAEQFGFLARLFVAEMYSSKKAIGNFNKPVLIIHSKEDNTVPFEMGETLFEQANEPKSFLSIEKDHLAGLALYTDQITNEIIKLLNR